MAEKAKREAVEYWDVDDIRDEIIVPIILLRDDKEIHLEHIFREPTAADKSARLKYLSRTKIDRRNKGVVETDYPGANSLLWSRCIKDVKGYKKGGQDLNNTMHNWKSFVPMDHQSIATEKLLAECGLELDEDEAKN